MNKEPFDLCDLILPDYYASMTIEDWNIVMGLGKVARRAFAMDVGYSDWPNDAYIMLDRECKKDVMRRLSRHGGEDEAQRAAQTLDIRPLI